ncbi:MAG: diguanylate cyclase, partial [Pigmentiphaga sp.]
PSLLPPALHRFLPNLLILLALAWFSVALRRFDRIPTPSVAIWGGLVIALIGLAVFEWAIPHTKTRVAVVSIAWLAYMIDGLLLLLRARRPSRSPAETGLLAIYGLLMAGILLRLLWYLWLPLPATFSILDNSTWVNRLSPLLALLLSTIGTSAFLLMCYVRQYQRVRQQSLTDPLTGLGNRALLATLSASAKGPGGVQTTPPANGAVLLIDLDRFKIVNDAYGHAAGDRVLAEAARRLRATARPQDVVLRLGGDEFAIVIRDPLTRETVRKIAHRTERALAGTYDAGAALVELGASIGAAVAPPGGGPAPPLGELFEMADRAMYDVKRQGGGVQVSGDAAVSRGSAQRPSQAD